MHFLSASACLGCFELVMGGDGVCEATVEGWLTTYNRRATRLKGCYGRLSVLADGNSGSSYSLAEDQQGTDLISKWFYHLSDDLITDTHCSQGCRMQGRSWARRPLFSPLSPPVLLNAAPFKFRMFGFLSATASLPFGYRVTKVLGDTYSVDFKMRFAP